jgi:hypothetical protein
MTADPREEKLPRWVQSLVVTERSRRHAAERKLAEFMGDADNDKPTAVLRGHSRPDVSLGRHPEIRFYLEPELTAKENESRERYVDVGIADDGTVEVRTGTSMMIYPRVSNGVSIDSRHWIEHPHQLERAKEFEERFERNRVKGLSERRS